MKNLCFQIRKREMAEALGLEWEKYKLHWVVFFPEDQNYSIFSPNDLHSRTRIENFDQIMMKTMSR